VNAVLDITKECRLEYYKDMSWGNGKPSAGRSNFISNTKIHVQAGAIACPTQMHRLEQLQSQCKCTGWSNCMPNANAQAGAIACPMQMHRLEQLHAQYKCTGWSNCMPNTSILTGVI
jgi:hypothetical protein